MRPGLLVVSALALAPLAAPAQASIAPTKAQSAPVRRTPLSAPFLGGPMSNLELAATRVGAEDFGGALEILRPLIETNEFLAMPVKTRRSGLYLTGVSALKTQQYQEAHDLLRRASEMEGADGWAWLMRVSAALGAEDHDDALFAFETLVIRHPAMLQQVSDEGINGLYVDSLRLPRGEIRQMALMNTLLDVGWAPKDPINDWSAAWSTHAGRLLDRLEFERATLAARRVTAPQRLIGMRADWRFASLVVKNPAAFNIKEAYARQLDRLQTLSRADPTSLHRVNALGLALLDMKRDDELLALTEEALGRLAAPTGSPMGLSDPEAAIWTRDLQARALRALGRSDEAEAAWRQAIAQADGRASTPLLLNLAKFLADMERPREALAALTGLDTASLSTRGALLVDSVRACAHAQLGDVAARDQALAALRRKQDFAPDLYMDALACVNDLDAAALSLMERLDDTGARMEALIEVQTFPEPPPRSETERARQAHRRALLADPQVRGAISLSGKVETQPYPRPFR